MDRSLPGPSVHGVLQGRTLEMAAMPSSRDLPNEGMEAASLMSAALAGSLHEGHLGSPPPNTGQADSNSAFELRLNTASSKLSSLLFI